MILERASRGDLEILILEEEILDVRSADGIAAIERMTDDELRAAVRAWIEAGDECASAGSRASHAG